MPTRLIYSFITSPTPLPVSPAGGAPATATLRLIATNATREKEVVRLEALSFRVPVGPEAGQLTAASASIASVPPSGWVLHNVKADPGSTTYIFYPLTVPYELLPAQGLVFTLNNLQPNAAVGTASVFVTEGTAGNPTTSLEISKCPPSWDGLNFGVTPLTVAAGTGVQLDWRGPAGADFTYRIKYYDFAADAEVTLPLPGKPAFASHGTYPGLNDPALLPTQSTTFTLVVNAVIGGQPVSVQLQARAEVIVPPPRFRSFRVEPNPVVIGQPRPAIRLSWQTSDAVSMQVEGHSFTGAEAREGSMAIAPQKTRRYVGQAYGATGGQAAPASATAWALYQQTQTIEADATAGRPAAGPFAITVEPGGVIFKISGSRHYPTRDPNPYSTSPEWVDMTEWNLELQPGFELADLSAYGPAATYEQIIEATYNRSLGPHSLVAKTYIRMYEPWAKHNTNWMQPKSFATWGVRLSNGAYGLFWVSGSDFNRKDDGVLLMNITYKWIAYENALHGPDYEVSAMN